MPILKNLLAHDLMDQIAHVMIDFDIRKVPSQKHEIRNIISALKKRNLKNYSMAHSTMIGHTHQDRINFWLSHLDFAETFMSLTPAQKKWRLFPLFVRKIVARIHKKLKRML